MDTILRAILCYWVLLFTLRILGRRAVSQLTPFELIVIFLLGGMTIQSVVADDRSVVNAILGVLTIAANHVIVSALKQRSVTLRKIIDGTPIVVVDEGRLDKSRLHGLRMLEEDVMAAARQNGLKRMEQIRFAIVERDGNITVFKKE